MTSASACWLKASGKGKNPNGQMPAYSVYGCTCIETQDRKESIDSVYFISVSTLCEVN